MRLRVDIHVATYEYFLPLLLVPHFFASLRRHSHRLFPPSLPSVLPPLLLLISTTTDNLICSQNRRAAVLIGIRTLCPLSLFILRLLSSSLVLCSPSLLAPDRRIAPRRAPRDLVELHSALLDGNSTVATKLVYGAPRRVVSKRDRSLSLSLSLRVTANKRSRRITATRARFNVRRRRARFLRRTRFWVNQTKKKTRQNLGEAEESRLRSNLNDRESTSSAKKRERYIERGISEFRGVV